MQSLSVKRSTVGLQEGIDVGKVTLTIADRDGVSRTTVSNAFSRPDQLSEELLHRIRAVANELVTPVVVETGHPPGDCRAWCPNHREDDHGAPYRTVAG
jgi:hypothetical protein